MADDQKSWWTPNGWVRSPPPPPFLASIELEDAQVWDEVLAKNGYNKLHQFGDSALETVIDVTVWRHADEHLIVAVSDCDRMLAEFFVSDVHSTQFIVERLPILLSGYGLIETELSTIRKTLIAFVRHGHGVRTIDRYGEESLEEMDESAERWREAKAKRAAAERAKAETPP
jgi:hypothetical protein